MRILIILCLLSGMVVSIGYAQAPTVHGLPPPAKPHRVSAAEGFPPLPLPVVPMRRSEQKRPPQPLALIAKIKRSYSDDWRGTIADMKQLLAWVSPRLNVSYTSNELSLSQFSFDPKTLPIIYLTGHRKVIFTDSEKEKLRQYLLNGGTIIGNACCGDLTFYESFKKEIGEILADRPFVQISLDHPIYNSYYEVKKIKYRRPSNEQSAKGAPTIEDVPILEGINIGCRIAVILSGADMAAGWDSLIVPTAKFLVEPEDALKLGTNIIAYCLAFHQTAQQFTRQPVYEDVEKEKGGEFVFAQVMHNGDWDPHRGAVSRFLTKIKENTASDMKLRRVTVDLSKDDLFSYPFLYITGHLDFKLSAREVSNLVNYLRKGGFLFASSCCGNKEFDSAFHREMKKVFPNYELKQLESSHSIFDSFYTIKNVQYTQKTKLLYPDIVTPYFEGIDIEGHLGVVYSPFGLIWDEMMRPYSVSVMPEDSLKLGINTVVYSLSH